MIDANIEIIRLGHRAGRDPRITTHLALVGRAMGGNEFILCGDKDQKLLDNIDSVNSRFGFGIKCRHESQPMKYLREITESTNDNRPIVVHLTMYGEPYREIVPSIPKDRGVVVVVGGAKVPGEIFKTCDYNIAIGNQPHSEVAALALFLDIWREGNSFTEDFSNPKLVINPSKSGKEVKEL
tara:strand:+ start:197 stop:742 length:546 start_codon:yes stop_codon:yes gene_type:complete